MAATATSSLSSFKRALVICVFLGLFTSTCPFLLITRPWFQIFCQEMYVKDSIGTMRCEIDLKEFDKLCGGDDEIEFFNFEFIRNNPLCRSYFNKTVPCSANKGDEVPCSDKAGTYYCSFNATDKHNQSTPYCQSYCNGHIDDQNLLLVTNSCTPLILGTAPPPTTAPPPPPKQESKFSLLMAIIIPCAVAAFIGLVLLMVWRKRRQAQRDVEANPEGERKATPQGEGDENPEGEGDEDADAEEAGDEDADAEDAGDEDADAEDAGDEDAEGEESEQPEKSSEVGEEKTEEE